MKSKSQFTVDSRRVHCQTL